MLVDIFAGGYGRLSTLHMGLLCHIIFSHFSSLGRTSTLQWCVGLLLWLLTLFFSIVTYDPAKGTRQTIRIFYRTARIAILLNPER